MNKKATSRKRAKSSKQGKVSKILKKPKKEVKKMGKKTVSRKRARGTEPRKQIRIEDFKGVKKIDPDAYLADEKNIALAILECLQNNDPEGVMEVLAIYVESLNKTKLMQEGEIPKSTFYHALRRKNPTIKTLARIISSSIQETN